VVIAMHIDHIFSFAMSVAIHFTITCHRPAPAVLGLASSSPGDLQDTRGSTM
jgi:hypothetical protein